MLAEVVVNPLGSHLLPYLGLVFTATPFSSLHANRAVYFDVHFVRLHGVPTASATASAALAPLWVIEPPVDLVGRGSGVRVQTLANDFPLRRSPLPFVRELAIVFTNVPVPHPSHVPPSFSVRHSRAGHQATIATQRAFTSAFTVTLLDAGGEGNGQERAASPGVNYT